MATGSIGLDGTSRIRTVPVSSPPGDSSMAARSIVWVEPSGVAELSPFGVRSDPRVELCGDGALPSVESEPPSLRVGRSNACAFSTDFSERKASSSLSLPKLSFGVFKRMPAAWLVGVASGASSSDESVSVLLTLL
eukprot:scaffold164083_cov30-Tisochrysis_lutea.AAC.1